MSEQAATINEPITEKDDPWKTLLEAMGRVEKRIEEFRAIAPLTPMTWNDAVRLCQKYTPALKPIGVTLRPRLDDARGEWWGVQFCAGRILNWYCATREELIASAEEFPNPSNASFENT